MQLAASADRQFKFHKRSAFHLHAQRNVCATRRKRAQKLCFELRNLFATRCIESGVDIPTVSRWLGHKDGGALAMKTYGHLRREHSIAQAQRVTFAPVTTKQADVIPFPVTG
jgi:integrase